MLSRLKSLLGSGEPLPTVTPLEAQARVERGDAALVDVRELGEWRQMRIPGAVHMPLSSLPQSLGLLPKGKPIVFYCLSGARSASAASLCRQAGIAQVENLSGGISAWRAAGLPVTA